MLLKKILKKTIKTYTSFVQRFSNTYYISIGENCLTDNILDRHNIKSFSTPYSHGRSNLDYAISLEKENYSNLLKSEYLYFDYVGNTQVVRNKHYSKCDDIYNELHQNGFEFTHHNIINNVEQRKSYDRKVLRMKSLNKTKKLKFFYHYRNNDNRNLNSIIAKAKEFLTYYQKRGIQCEFIFFTQNIILNKENRRLLKIHDSNNVIGYTLNTLKVWSGDDKDVFWARNDDDLIAKMLKQVK